MGPILEYRVSARRIDTHGSAATAKDAEVILDTDINRRPDAFNPAALAELNFAFEEANQRYANLQWSIWYRRIFSHKFLREIPRN